jgi:hypothetical protein
MGIKRYSCIILLSLIASAAAPTDTLLGAGIGVYGNAGGGQAYLFREGFQFRFRGIVNTTLVGGGFIADTNLSGSGIFNNRFKLGYDFQKADNGAIGRLNRVSASNIFGAGFYCNRVVRIWAGPQVGFGYLWGKNVFHDVTFDTSLPFYSFPPGPLGYASYKSSVTYSMFNLHAGAALGININLDEHVTVPVEAGFRLHLYTDFSPGGAPFDNLVPEGYVTIGILYRYDENVPGMK